MLIINIRLFIVKSRGGNESGCTMPKIGYNSFTKRPVNVKKAILSPTEKRMFSSALSLLIFSNLMIMIPGNNEK